MLGFWVYPILLTICDFPLIAKDRGENFSGFFAK